MQITYKLKACSMGHSRKGSVKIWDLYEIDGDKVNFLLSGTLEKVHLYMDENGIPDELVEENEL